MAFDNTVTLVGNITRDPELRFTPAGIAVANFGLAWNRKNRDGEESVSFFDVTCWRDLAENVAESLSKGNRVVVYGRLDQQTWENDNGERRSKVEVIADEVAPSLRWATADVTRTEFKGEAGGSAASGGGSAPGPAPTHSTDEEPF
ncbi:MAG TPA: single-stranded DNA-binding protein [Acidimicrobiales bacterium]|jgi:single-strand DNA-binding protein|nr:single-stranded DNA-binding protein [Acidimicrobiales bacterium]MDP6213405.1 single-stranded DNA-binding protein [Acidimicrobiales bacterium]MDP7209582.1 single-stranded DNA-binding protein [Acidimicrobiales bacterium]HJL89269.1 single-stranded DNA-binding protein [Acidimicrobiales bacterium]HJO98246.1 single-stranded DNA-binding protein [Acidimicrobiales bacterium]